MIKMYCDICKREKSFIQFYCSKKSSRNDKIKTIPLPGGATLTLIIDDRL